MWLRSKKQGGRTMPFEMKSGLEMDALVARMCFDWRYSTIEEYAHLKLSTTWEGARIVIEEMRRRGKCVTIIDNPFGAYDVKFGDQLEFTRLSNLPHAVCTAAILTVWPKAIETTE
jgi:hypothetical protein